MLNLQINLNSSNNNRNLNIIQLEVPVFLGIEPCSPMRSLSVRRISWPIRSQLFPLIYSKNTFKKTGIIKIGRVIVNQEIPLVEASDGLLNSQTIKMKLVVCMNRFVIVRLGKASERKRISSSSIVHEHSIGILH